jgi:hypothetical protein
MRQGYPQPVEYRMGKRLNLDFFDREIIFDLKKSLPAGACVIR